MRMKTTRSRFAAALLAGAVAAAPATAQQDSGQGDAREAGTPGIATLDQEALFLQSEFGQRVQRELEQDRDALAAENRRIEAELMEEERALTEKRGEIPPQEFADLAEAFDAKVQRIRERQDRKARRLQQSLDRARQRFLNEVGPVLTDLLRKRGAAILIDSNAVLISVEGIDLTDEAIAAIDARLGDGGEEGLSLPDATAPPTDDTPDAGE